MSRLPSIPEDFASRPIDASIVYTNGMIFAALIDPQRITGLLMYDSTIRREIIAGLADREIQLLPEVEPDLAEQLRIYKMNSALNLYATAIFAQSINDQRERISAINALTALHANPIDNEIMIPIRDVLLPAFRVLLLPNSSS